MSPTSRRRSEACLLCGTPVGETDTDPDGYRVCPKCDLAWSVDEDPAEPASDWDHDYYGDPAVVSLHQTRRSAMEAIVDRLQALFPQPGRLLDIGAGLGVLMQAAAATGWRVEGVEPSSRAAEWARRQTGAPVYCGLLEDLELSQGAYDVVTIVDVLRSVPSPLEFLRAVRRLVRPGGVLLIRDIHREAERRYRRLIGQVGGRKVRGRRTVFEYGQCFSPRSLLYSLRAVGIEEAWVEPSPMFVESGSVARLASPLVKRAVSLLSRALYRGSGRRMIVSPNILAFGRVPSSSGR